MNFIEYAEERDVFRERRGTTYSVLRHTSPHNAIAGIEGDVVLIEPIMVYVSDPGMQSGDAQILVSRDVAGSGANAFGLCGKQDRYRGILR